MSKRPKIPDLDHRITEPTRRGITIGRCRTCRTWVMLGIDADVCAFPAVADWQPLTPLGEVAAVLGERRTYALEPDRPPRHSLKLTYRSARTIARYPADADRQADVVAEHRCKAAPLPQQATRLPDTPAEQKEMEYDQPPPF